MLIGQSKRVFSRKENLEYYLETNIGQILIPFSNDFTLGERISKMEIQKNPMNKSKEILASLHLTLESVHKESDTAIFIKETQFDQHDFTEVMKTKFKKNSKPFDLSDSLVELKLKEMNTILVI